MLAKKPVISDETSRSELRTIFRASHGGPLQCIIDENASPVELLHIIAQHKAEEYYDVLLEILVTHPSANEQVLTLVVDNESDPGILNAIATSGRAPSPILRRLLSSEDASVRQHAELGLLHIELAGAAPERFIELLREYPGEEGIDLGVRALLADHKRTPRDVLERLAHDDIDFIRKAAIVRLSDK